MPTPDTDYASYMLRLRRIKTGDTSIWIPSLESTATGYRYSFPNLDALYDFLNTEFGSGEAEADSGCQTAKSAQASRYSVVSDRDITVS